MTNGPSAAWPGKVIRGSSAWHAAETLMGIATDSEHLVDETLEEFQGFDLDPYGQHKAKDGVPTYLRAHRHEYIRTLNDVLAFAERHECKRVLEIGAFFGVVSVCLSKRGFAVSAVDIPEYMLMAEQKRRYEHYAIDTAGVRLQDYLLPFEDESFDVVIMCEVLEHLNFNPLPLLKEINRIGRPDSLFYLSLPNLAQYMKRLRLLFGRPILIPIQSYFDQLDPDKLEIVNDHWREYTGPEIRELLERMGYRIERQYYFSVVETFKKPSLKNRLTRTVYKLFPAFKENQTTLAIRQQRTPLLFQIPKTVHPTLERL
jgi:SAM-dependent methyltransferase